MRRIACESLARGAYQPKPEPLTRLLADPDRFVAWAAGRALQRLPVDQWSDLVVEAESPRAFLAGSIALLAVEPSDATLDAIITRGADVMNGFLNDDDFVDLLRVFQRGLDYGKLTHKNVPDLCKQLSREFPANESPDRVQKINRELTQLLVYLQESSVLERFLGRLESDVSMEEKLNVAFYVRFIEQGWTTDQKLRLLEFYEKAHDLEGGHSLAGYVDNACRDFVATFDDEQRERVFAQALRWPVGALWVLAGLPENPGEKILSQLIELDGRWPKNPSPAEKRLATGVVAVLGRSQDPTAMDHLREQFETKPERREDLAMGLAQSPGGKNWSLLLRALPIVEGVAAQEVLSQLATVNEVAGRLRDDSSDDSLRAEVAREWRALAVNLLARWTGEKPHRSGDSWDQGLAAWQEWFRENYPDDPAPELPAAVAKNKWNYDELLGFLGGDHATQGDPQRGESVFSKAQCIKCHRFGGRGEGVGPDLTTVSQRFQRKEILESLMFPSQVISDQYASKTIVTEEGRTFTGIVAPLGTDSVVVLQSNGQKVTISKDEISETAASRTSAMPEGLLNELSLDEIADLFSYLGTAPKGTKFTVQQRSSLRE